MSARLSRLLAPLAMGAALGLAACHPAAPDTRQAPGVEDAWVRLAPLPDRPAAAYLVIRGGAAPDRLVAISSPKAGRVELHASGIHAGMATMHAIDGVAVPPGGKAALAPGGDHAMLFGVDPAVRPGDPLPLSLRFASGATLTAEARTIAAGDPAPTGSPQ